MIIIGLIWSIVKRFGGRGYELEDLYQIGCIGFIKSIKRFDTNFDVKLSTYSVPYMIGEIKRFIRDDGTIKVSRSIKELNTKINELQKHYLTKYGRDISLEEISKELRVTKEEVAFALEALNPVESIEKNIYSGNDEKEIGLIDKISTGKNEEELITNKIVVKELIDGLEKRDKELILLRFYKEKTQSQVAKILERKILDLMKRKLQNKREESFCK